MGSEVIPPLGELLDDIISLSFKLIDLTNFDQVIFFLSPYNVVSNSKYYPYIFIRFIFLVLTLETILVETLSRKFSFLRITMNGKCWSWVYSVYHSQSIHHSGVYLYTTDFMLFEFAF